MDSPDLFINAESFNKETLLCVARRCLAVLLWLFLELFLLCWLHAFKDFTDFKADLHP